MDLRVCGRCERVHGSGATCPGCGTALSLADAAFFIGKTFGKYTVERVLGAGGMGVVYGARHATLNRPAAVKLVLPQLMDEAFLKRFLREAQVLAELKHPNIVEVYDFDVSPWGPPYYVMEYLEGRTLREMIERHGRGLVLSDYASLLRDLDAALSFAHRKGVVHRDLKPENVFVASFDGRAVGKVLDFGIAKLMSGADSSTNLTLSGTVMGTPHYLAPEQLLVQPVGGYTDLYALALMAAEMVTGLPVRAGKSFGEICSVEIKKPLPAQWPGHPEISPGAAAALARATQPDPASRFPDVHSFVEALELPPPSADPGRLGQLARAGGGDGTTALTPPSHALSPRAGSSPARRPSGPSPPPTEALPTPAAVPPTRPSAQPAPAEGPATAPASARPAGRRLLPWAAAAALALAAAAVVFFYWPRHRGAAGTGPSQPAAAVAKPLLEPAGEIPLPPDASALLGRRLDENVCLLLGPGCVYLASGKNPVPARIPLGPGQEVLGTSPACDVYVRDGARVVVRDFVSNREELLVKALPPGGRYQLSPSGDHLLAAAERGGDLAVFRVGGGACREVLRAKNLPEPLGRAAVGDRYLVAVAGETLMAWDLTAGQLLWKQPLPDYGVRALALEEASGEVALGGAFDKVYVFALKDAARTVIQRRGETYALRFLADAPTLVVAGAEGVKLWRRGGEGFFAGAGEPEARFSGLSLSAGVLMALDEGRRAVRLFAYHGLPPIQSIPVAKKEIWALAADPKGRRLYCGSSDGDLHVLEAESGRCTTHQLHTQGLTALAASADLVASSSDDKTIAVWQTPAMSVIWRSKAHGYLINGLCLRADALWSSSSDGTVKRWAWPQLEEQEGLPTGKSAAGENYALATVWAAADGRTVLAGTWNDALVVFRKTAKGSWDREVLPVPCQCLYSSAELPGVDAVALGGLGGGKPGVFLYDLKRRSLLALPALGVHTYNAYVASTGAPGEFCAAGAGLVLHYKIERGADGTLSAAVRAVYDADISAGVAAAFLPSRDLLATGDERGTIHLIPAAALRGEPLLRQALK